MHMVVRELELISARPPMWLIISTAERRQVSNFQMEQIIQNLAYTHHVYRGHRNKQALAWIRIP